MGVTHWAVQVGDVHCREHSILENKNEIEFAFMWILLIFLVNFSTEKNLLLKNILCPPFQKNPNCDQYQNILSRAIKNNLFSFCGMSLEILTFVNQSMLLSLALCCCTGGNALLVQDAVFLGVGNQVWSTE